MSLSSTIRRTIVTSTITSNVGMCVIRGDAYYVRILQHFVCIMRCSFSYFEVGVVKIASWCSLTNSPILPPPSPRTCSTGVFRHHRCQDTQMFILPHSLVNG